MRQAEGEALTTSIFGVEAVCDPSGVLLLPEEQTLVVSDLHLEKGAAHARRGMMLPPYDTAATLSLLTNVIARHTPKRVVCLGDSFHDRRGAASMPTVYRDALARLTAGCDWVWISGNHDPEPPLGLGGETMETLSIGRLTLRHEPTPERAPGEIAGHLHPAARVAVRGRSVRGSCFASDGERMILPSFGVTTGGLNVLDAAFAGLFALERACAFVIGLTRIHPIAFTRLSTG